DDGTRGAVATGKSLRVVLVDSDDLRQVLHDELGARLAETLLVALGIAVFHVAVAFGVEGRHVGDDDGDLFAEYGPRFRLVAYALHVERVPLAHPARGKEVELRDHRRIAASDAIDGAEMK